LDYILFGFGTGATLALGGWLFRDLGPRIRDRAPAEGDVLSASEMVSRMAWARFCSSCGAALAMAGIILMLATIATAVWNPSDEDGLRVVLVTYAVVIVLMLIWAGLFLRLFGAMGIIRPREAKPATAALAKLQVTEPSPEGSAQASVAGDVGGAAEGKSFDEVASARGGLGRFAAFFRRDTPVDDVQEADDRLATDTGTEATEGAVEPAASASTGEDAESKRLPVDDPLVMELMGEIPQERVVEPDLEADLISELEMPGTDSDELATDDTSFKPDSDTDSDEDEPRLSPEQQALDLLRRKRLARLSGQQDDE
jgi:hypothetical protein